MWCDLGYTVVVNLRVVIGAFLRGKKSNRDKRYYQDMEMLKELGRRIQKARKVKKLTQQELADLSHVSLKHVQSCERGKKNPSFEVLRELCKVLNLSLDSLMNLDLPEDEQSANDMRQLYLSCPPAARKALLNSARALADELKEMTQADECDQDKKAEEK